jgi:cytochrome c oxidase assembly factor CtaG
MMTAAFILMAGIFSVEFGLAPESFKNMTTALMLITGIYFVDLGRVRRKQAEKNWKALLVFGIVLCLIAIASFVIGPVEHPVRFPNS